MCYTIKKNVKSSIVEQEPRATFHVSLKAKDGIVKISDWSGIPQRLIVERVMEWIGEQPQDIQGAIIGTLPQAQKPEFAKMLLKQMAEAETKKAKDIGSILGDALAKDRAEKAAKQEEAQKKRRTG